jgi:hypothetical protein
MMTVGGLAAFARQHPAGDEARSMRRLGRRSGCPDCCVEFYVALIALVWCQIPEVEAYWRRAGEAGKEYVPCPKCLGVPVTELLE